MGQIGFKQTVSNAVDDFAHFFGRNQQSAAAAKWMLRFASIGFSYVSLKMLLTKWTDLLDGVAFPEGILMAASIVLALIIEFGWNNWLPVTIRQVVHWKFDDKYWRIMFGFNVSLVLIFGGLNLWTIYLGGDYVGKNTLPEFRYTDLDSLRAEAQEMRDSIYTAFKPQEEDVKNRSEEINNGFRKEAESKVSQANAQISYLRKREAAESQSYRTERYRYRADAEAAEAERDAKIAAQNQKLDESLWALKAERDAAIAAVNRWYEEKASPIKAGDVERKGNYDKLEGGFYFIILMLSAASYFGIFLITVIAEIYKKQTGQITGDYRHEYRTSIVTLFLTRAKKMAEDGAVETVGLFGRFLQVIGNILFQWFEYFVDVIEMKTPTPTKKPQNIEIDPFGVRTRAAMLAAQNKGQQPGGSTSYQLGSTNVGQQGSTGQQPGGSTQKKEPGSTAENELTTDFDLVNEAQGQQKPTTGQQEKPAGGSTGQQPGGSTGGQQVINNQIKIEVNGEEPMWPHVDGHTGENVLKNESQCKSSRASYRTKIRKHLAKIQKVKQGVLSVTETEQELLTQLAELRKLEAYWDNALNHIRQAKAELKRLKLSNDEN